MGAGAAGTPEGRARQAEGAARAGALRRECGSEEIVRGGGIADSAAPPPAALRPAPLRPGQDTDPEPQEDSGVLGALGQKEDQLWGSQGWVGMQSPHTGQSKSLYLSGPSVLTH